MTTELSAEELARYRRQLALEGFGQAGQEALATVRVAVIGAGGIGSPVLAYLAAAGVGEIKVIDADTVELSNLHRQVIHSTGRVGEPKARSAASRMAELNPEVAVHTVENRLTAANALDLLGEADLVVDGSDNFDTRHVASWAAAQLGIPHVWGSILGWQAQVSVFSAARGVVYEDLYPDTPAPGEVPSCAEAGVVGPLVGQVGTLMAMEAIKLVAHLGEPLVGTLVYLDGRTGRCEYVPVAGDKETAAGVRSGRYLPRDPASREARSGAGGGAVAPVSASAAADWEVDDVPEGAGLLDVRRDDEYQAFHLPGAVHVPLDRILEGVVPTVPTETGEIVVYCAGGVRSAYAIQALQAQGVGGLKNLRGGINGWLDRRGG